MEENLTRVCQRCRFRVAGSYDTIYLTAVGLPPGGSSTVHIYTQKIHEQPNRHETIHRTTKLIHGTTQLRKSAGRAPSLRGIPWHLPYN